MSKSNCQYPRAGLFPRLLRKEIVGVFANSNYSDTARIMNERYPELRLTGHLAKKVVEYDAKIAEEISAERPPVTQQFASEAQALQAAALASILKEARAVEAALSKFVTLQEAFRNKHAADYEVIIDMGKRL